MYEEFFAQRLKKLREQKNLSAREMSIALGQNDSYINRLENQKGFPSMEVFLCICKYLREIIYTNTNFLYTIFEQKNKEGDSHGFLPAAYLQSTLKTEGWRKPAYEKVEKGSIRISCPASFGRMPHIRGGTGTCGGNPAQATTGVLLVQYSPKCIF